MGIAATVMIRLSETPRRPVAVAVTATPQGETTTSDYSLSASAVSFVAEASGDELTQSITVTATDDNEDDDKDGEGEAIELSFGLLPDGVTVSGNAGATVTIADNDVTVQFATDSYTAIEGGEAAAVMIQLNSSPKQRIEIPIMVERQGGAIADDYSLSATAVIFEAEASGNALTQIITVEATDDSEANDDDESLQLSIGPLPDGVAMGSQATTIVHLTDNDGDPLTEVTVAFATAAHIVEEGNSVAIMIGLSETPGRPVEIFITATPEGGADNSDYSISSTSVAFSATASGTALTQTVIVTATDDSDDDDGERIRLNFGTLPAGVTASSSASTVIVTFFDEDEDNDGLIDTLDNCPQIANPGQENHFSPGDGKGDACSLINKEINDTTANGPTLSDNDYFGRSVASLGDLDGDGGAATVLAVGANSDDAGGASRGALHLLYLNTDGTVQKTVEINDTTTNGPTLNNSDSLGTSIASLGDLDGSGGAAAVLAVGAYHDDAGGVNRGTAHLLYLNANGSVQKTVEINDTTTNGPTLNNFDNFGASVASLGDLDGSGGAAAVLAVGAYANDFGSTGSGVVHLLYLNTDGTVQKTVEINDTTVDGPTLRDNDRFGSSVASLGDLDGSGGAVAVLAVGAYADDAGGTDRGALHLLYLNTDGSVQKTVEINDNTVGGPVLNNSDRFGSSVASLGDLDGSGGTAAVLTVGAYYDDTKGRDRGTVHLLWLNADGTVQKTIEINDITVSGPTLNNGDYFGRSVASLGNLDGAGGAVAVLAVGADYDDAESDYRGTVHLFFIE